MITKIAIAALITIGGASHALAEDFVEQNRDACVMHFAPFEASNPADRARVIRGVKAAARDVCHGIVSAMDRRGCERDFTHDALATVEGEHRRIALLDAYDGRDSDAGHAAIVAVAPAS